MGNNFQEKETNNFNAALCITIFYESRAPEKFNLNNFNKQRISLGRRTDNDIVINSPIASGNHLEFILEDSRCLIRDLNSTNGILVNGRRVGTMALSDGDIITIWGGASNKKDTVLLVFSIEEDYLTWKRVSISGQKEVLIGRDKSCNIVLNHVSVSRVHSKITCLGNNCFIEDTGSTNGVVVNNQKLTGKRTLNNMDIIYIVNSKFIFINGELFYTVMEKSGISVTASVLSKVVKNNNNPKTILDKVSFNINSCEFTAIVGGSGAGKSTLLNCLCGYDKPTDGEIFVNGINLYSNYDMLRCIIGHVPQQDIVYSKLTLWDMLIYAAKLRMPDDTDNDEIMERVKQVISSVELTGSEDVLIHSLSGGQQKRASIAVELLSDPKLFFLDEPTSGLDPGTERNLMYTLKNMTQEGKTVIIVTHNTVNLHLCHKIIFMGYGGKMCFCGTPQEALRFFGTDNFIDIYNVINKDADKWSSYFNSRNNAVTPAKQPDSEEIQKVNQANRHSGIKQFFVLSARNAKLLVNDRKRLMLLMLQAPLLGLLLSLVAPDNPFKYYGNVKSLLFSLSCAAFWLGMLNSIQEICKESTIYERERMTSIKLVPYIGSKLLIQGILCFVQSLLLIGTFILYLNSMPDMYVPSSGTLILPQFLELWVTTFLASYGAAALGLFVSSISSNPDRAMTMAPLLLMPQILFSGVVFELKGFMSFIASIISSKWVISAYSVSVFMNKIPIKSTSSDTSGSSTAASLSPFDIAYESTSQHLAELWLILAAFIVVCSIMCFVSMLARDKN